MPSPATKADTTLALVKYKLPVDSITLLVYNPNHVLAWIYVADIRLAPVTDPPVPEPNVALLANSEFVIIALDINVSEILILPVTVPVVIPTKTLALL